MLTCSDITLAMKPVFLSTKLKNGQNSRNRQVSPPFLLYLFAQRILRNELFLEGSGLQVLISGCEGGVVLPGNPWA